MIVILTLVGLYLMIGNAFAVMNVDKFSNSQSNEEVMRQYILDVLRWPKTLIELFSRKETG